MLSEAIKVEMAEYIWVDNSSSSFSAVCGTRRERWWKGEPLPPWHAQAEAGDAWSGSLNEAEQQLFFQSLEGKAPPDVNNCRAWAALTARFNNLVAIELGNPAGHSVSLLVVAVALHTMEKACVLKVLALTLGCRFIPGIWSRSRSGLRSSRQAPMSARQ